MKRRQNQKLSFFEGLYVWLFIYTLKSKFLTGRGAPEAAASVWFALLQFFNLEVLWYSILLIFHINISYSQWIEIVVLVLLIIINVFIFQKNVDDIIDRHNALPLHIRLKYKLRLWIYLILTGLLLIGLAFTIRQTRDVTVFENQQKRNRTILKDCPRQIYGYLWVESEN